MITPPTLRDRVSAALEGFRTGGSPATEPFDRGADYPEPYPRGWYRVAHGAAVPRGEVLSVECLGRAFVVFRGEDSGKVSVLDAHCPHQGAHLGVGGRVEGDGLRCPFHHWAFDHEGTLCHVPGDQKHPAAGLQAWPTREVDGMIWIWWDPEEPGVAPRYEPESPLEPGMRLRGDHAWGPVDMHLVEFAENSVDFQHFDPVHGGMKLPWTQLRIPGIRIHHEAHWELDPARPHVSYFHDHATLSAFGRPLPRTEAFARITFFGPGGIVWFRFDIPDVGRILMYQTHTPLAPLRQQVHFRWYSEAKVPRLLASYVVGNWISQWQEDIAIWENKVYRRKPALSAADGPVHRMRRWWSRFEE